MHCARDQVGDEPAHEDMRNMGDANQRGRVPRIIAVWHLELDGWRRLENHLERVEHRERDSTTKDHGGCVPRKPPPRLLIVVLRGEPSLEPWRQNRVDPAA